MSGKIIKDSSALGQFGSAIAQICEEKGIEKEKVVESVEAALAAAYKKEYGRKGQIILAKMDDKTGEVVFRQLKEVVDKKEREFDEEKINPDFLIVPENSKKSEESFGEHIESEKPREEKRKEFVFAGDIEEGQEGEEGKLPRFNPEREVFLKEAKKVDKKIKVGDFIEIPLETKSDYGRVASQTAKQVIIQKIREAERDTMYEEYKSKEGEVVSGSIQRIEDDRVFIDIGKSTGALFYSEQIPGEHYRIGQRIKVYIDRVESGIKGPGIALSRRHPKLLEKLFELEVPEVFTGTVEIKAIAREAGNRSKIAVISHEEGIDPIGSCVGQKGTRVQAVIDELSGEKIDIIEWDDDPKKLISSALAPAKVISVEAKDEIKKEAKAYVVKEQLSLAIGKRGQNVRLAAKLTGWKIDVMRLEEEGENEKELKVEPSLPAGRSSKLKEEKDTAKKGENEKSEDK